MNIDQILKRIDIPSNKRVVVGMSGGVDSSVTAALLKEVGCEPIGLFMKNWEDTLCPAEQDASDVAQVAKQLQIPFYTVNFTKEYRERVFAEFLRDLKAGYTPNPDILCNREIKFHYLLERAKKIGDTLATGHYATIVHHTHHELHKGDDLTKDQSYFLYTATEEQLSHMMFPLGTLKKHEVRMIAEQLNLVVAHKKDSTGICFIGERSFRSFISEYIPSRPGPIQTLSGKTIGIHMGIEYYTIGQRKGLGIGGNGSAWFVAGKDVKENILYVVQGNNDPSLFRKELYATETHWIHPPKETNVRCTAKIRYRQEDQPCLVTLLSNQNVHVTFDSPQRAVTPRQAIVFYQGSQCLGGGFIHHHNLLIKD